MAVHDRQWQAAVLKFCSVLNLYCILPEEEEEEGTDVTHEEHRRGVGCPLKQGISPR